MNKMINYDKVARHLEEAKEEHGFYKCVLCGLILASSVDEHLEQHKSEGLK